ncbi:sugar phosphate isomerase/epimerase family protein [Beijerinckia mobilis]|uniref:sugar phosphate isomerase/epimerase family protein n=1 Tax=Beijerinckia mobilis TaxID=231434 RepID=UPI000553B15C|nr:sugar phosphate isomerase/epimerase [Beijerinckia mobilis]
MSRSFSLAHLTVLSLTPPEMTVLAHKLGYDSIGIRLMPASPEGPAYPLMDDPSMLAETLARMADTGISVFDLEIIRLNETFDVKNYLSFFEVGAKLGAKAMLVAGDDPDESRLISSFAALCEAAAPFGLTADLEFMPWTKVPNLRCAIHVVKSAGCANGGILVDALHFARSDSHYEDLQMVPTEWLHYAQMCDAPAKIPDTDESLIYTARCERLLPGEGGIDLHGLFNRLPPQIPVSLEIPNMHRIPLMGLEEWSRQALAAGRSILAQQDADKERPAA